MTRPIINTNLSDEELTKAAQLLLNVADDHFLSVGQEIIIL